MVKYRRYVRRITPKLYKEIKSKLHYPADDDAVREEYKLGKTTVRSIRNTKDWFEYRRRTGHDQVDLSEAWRGQLFITNNKLADNDRPKTSTKNPSQTAQNAEQNALVRAVGLFIVFCLCLTIGGITIGILRWALGF